ncbi:hypothetical protein V6N11_021613 [Hibiscus sabdariffa]|uniref:Uncharacterized protein n=1 Tax=Hibiscus sabdariffa TaxID=183260 RepID=A0ABR2PBE9_9ROSI
MICLLLPGVLRSGLGSPLTRSSLSLLIGAAFWHDVDRGEARRAWLAASMHGYLESPRMEPGSLPLHLGLFFTTRGAPIGGCAPLSCCPTPCDTGPLARPEHWQLWLPPLPIRLGVHRFPCASACFYVVVACLSSRLLLFVCPAPSADPWVHVHRCVTCSTLGGLGPGYLLGLAIVDAGLHYRDFLCYR